MRRENDKNIKYKSRAIKYGHTLHIIFLTVQ